MKDLHHHRQNYQKGELLEHQIPESPVELFQVWFEEAGQSGIKEPNAMALCTATPDGMPSARMVLLKAFSEEGFIFYTNYHSRKGEEIALNPKAALLFYWDIPEQQIRIEGAIEKISFHLSEQYFSARPFESRLSAVVSEQSKPIAGRAVLEERLAELRKQPVIARPEYWGGYRLIPSYFEFWQGRPNRLHDRIFYRKDSNSWLTGRLSP